MGLFLIWKYLSLRRAVSVKWTSGSKCSEGVKKSEFRWWRLMKFSLRVLMAVLFIILLSHVKSLTQITNLLLLLANCLLILRVCRRAFLTTWRTLVLWIRGKWFCPPNIFCSPWYVFSLVRLVLPCKLGLFCCRGQRSYDSSKDPILVPSKHRIFICQKLFGWFLPPPEISNKSWLTDPPFYGSGDR